jgi:hypothetical protein
MSEIVMFSAFVVLVVIIVAVNVQHYFRNRDGDWHEDADHYQMRRQMPDGSWEYRKMTPREENERWKDSVW